ncbi:MAG: hypothetical protein WCG85_03470 [Polyangia bacterium]
MGEGEGVFVWGARPAESVGRGRERSACRGPLTLPRPPTLAASRSSLTLPLTRTLANLRREFPDKP